MIATPALDGLPQRIRNTVGQVDAFLSKAMPRKRRLLNITIIAGTLAAALTAGPAVGGAPFTAWLTGALGLTSPSWRLLCGLATVCSIASAIATQLLKSTNLEEQVARAQSCRAKLESLELGLGLGYLSEQQAAVEYLRCAEDAAILRH